MIVTNSLLFLLTPLAWKPWTNLVKFQRCTLHVPSSKTDHVTDKGKSLVRVDFSLSSSSSSVLFDFLALQADSAA